MLSRDAHLPSRIGKVSALLRGLVVSAALATGVAGCGSDGFRPLYGPSANGTNVQEKMASVEVAHIPSRVGQRIRNELIFQNTGGGERAPPRYRLEIAIRESISSTLVNSQGEALSQIYSLEAQFKLINIADKKVLLQGGSHARAAFERYPSIYSNVRAREDAENRAASTMADELRLRIAGFLSNDKV
jgi:LPS-assembly lipoprotein